MREQRSLPNESSVEFRIERIIDQSPLLVEWLGGLDADDSRRAQEWFMHVGHTLYEQGIANGQRVRTVTDEDRERIFGAQLEIFSQGITAQRELSQDLAGTEMSTETSAQNSGGAQRFAELIRRKRDSGELTDKHLRLLREIVFGTDDKASNEGMENN